VLVTKGAKAALLLLAQLFLFALLLKLLLLGDCRVAVTLLSPTSNVSLIVPICRRRSAMARASTCGIAVWPRFPLAFFHQTRPSPRPSWQSNSTARRWPLCLSARPRPRGPRWQCALAATYNGVVPLDAALFTFASPERRRHVVDPRWPWLHDCCTTRRCGRLSKSNISTMSWCPPWVTRIAGVAPSA
jgi:hypothetical protein